MNASEERLIARDLSELLGKERAPDLVERTLARLHSQALKLATQPEPAPAPLIELSPRRWLRFVEAACVILALGIVGWLALPRSLPENIHAGPDARFALRGEFIELQSGALLLETGAPEVRAADAKITQVHGRAVVRLGSIPTPEQLTALVSELPLTEKEKPVLKEIKRWSMAAGVALCVLSGSVMLNEQLIVAQKDADTVETPSPKPEDIEGVQKLLEQTASISISATNSDWRLCTPVEVSKAAEVKELVDAIYSGLKLSKAPAGWEPDNRMVFNLRSGASIQIHVNIKAGLADIRLKGWERWYEYDVRADLLKRFKPWFEKSVAQGPDVAAPAGLRKLRGWSGNDSNISKREFAVAADSATWAEIWGRHQPDSSQVPEVDFEREMVLALFAGARDSCRALELVEIIDDQRSNPEDYIIRFAADLYPVSRVKNPYGIFVLSRTEARINLEENIEPMVNKPARWNRIGLMEGRKLLRDRLTPPEFSRLRGSTGDDSKIAEKCAFYIDNLRDWDLLQVRHGAAMPKLNVDFETEIVVAVFQRVPKGWGGVELEGLLANSQRAQLRVRRDSYQTEMVEGAPALEIVTAYGFHVFPKTGRSLVLEYPGGDFDLRVPQWHETPWSSLK